jgi:glycolate oxidase iron-sulfur subunit
MGSETPISSQPGLRLKLFDSPEAPSFEDVATCVHCGFCLEACPTYRDLRVEMDSPRGRIYLMKGLLTGQLEPTPSVVKHLNQCLDCRACETACPSGVPYASILESTRTVLESNVQRKGPAGWVRTLVFNHILPSRVAQRWALRGVRLAQTLGILALGKLTARLGLLPRRLAAAALNPPSMPPRSFRDTIAKAYDPKTKTFVFSPTSGPIKHRVALFTGCLADHMFAGANEATVQVLTENGCQVEVLPEESCCGALHIHNGARSAAKPLAQRNIDAFVPRNFDAIISNAAGCSAELRHTSHLLPGEEKAAQFDAKVKDVCEFLVQIGFRPPGKPARPNADLIPLAYDEPCHLLHAQKISAAPKAVLASLPKFTIVPLVDADTCCGSAGVYSILEPELSGRILNKKVEAIRNSGAKAVATGNPGCLLQIENGVRTAKLDIRVVHPVELLAEAYREERA